MAFSSSIFGILYKTSAPYSRATPHLSTLSPHASELPRQRPLLQLMSSASVPTGLRGFVLTRHWRDLPDGTEIEYWLATGASEAADLGRFPADSAPGCGKSPTGKPAGLGGEGTRSKDALSVARPPCLATPGATAIT